MKPETVRALLAVEAALRGALGDLDRLRTELESLDDEPDDDATLVRVDSRPAKTVPIGIQGAPIALGPLQRCCHVCSAVPGKPCQVTTGVPYGVGSLYSTSIVHSGRFDGVPF